MNARNIDRWQGGSWMQFFEDWILNLALVAAVFAAVISGAASLGGF
jgi:hypothetical protein